MPRNVSGNWFEFSILKSTCHIIVCETITMLSICNLTNFPERYLSTVKMKSIFKILFPFFKIKSYYLYSYKVQI